VTEHEPPEGGTATEPPPPPPPAARPPLRRRTDDRMVAGVASGLAVHLGLDVALVRVAIVALSFAAPPVVLAYLAAWLLVEEAGPSDGAASPRRERDAGFWVGAGLLVVVALALVGEIGPFGRGLWPLLLIALGVAFWRAQSEDDRSPHQPAAAARAPLEPGDGRGVPEPVRFDPPAPRPRSVGGRVTLALAAIAAGGLMLLDRLAGAAGPLVGGLPWPLSRFGQLGPFAPLAVALLVIGLGLVVTAFLGRARWLILVGLVLLPGVVLGGVARGFEIPLRGGLGSVDQVVVGGDELPPDGYHHAAGEVFLDLSDLDLVDADVTLPIRLGAGSVVVRIPADVAADVRARVLAGSIEMPGRPAVEGVRLDAGHVTTGTGPGALRLDITVGLGEVRVVEVDPEEGLR
jgi:phage shock protein PspC (stress-responsive transcriptional regulator)